MEAGADCPVCGIWGVAGPNGEISGKQDHAEGSVQKVINTKV